MYYWNKIYLYIISFFKNKLYMWHTEYIGLKTLSDYIFYWYYLLRILFFSIFGKKLYKIIKGIMANKRILKRKINYVCSELFSEVVAASYSIKADEENVKALLTSILVIHNDYIRRVSHVEPGMPATKFFKDLITKFNKQVSEIIDQISNFE